MGWWDQCPVLIGLRSQQKVSPLEAECSLSVLERRGEKENVGHD